ncbi:hypothetical protein [Sporosarcina sp. FA9]|uniref:hypothetical protein n=1 Tax=Sporosarcina sp. FA9 TaxID=3413030 RepID=UPI003F658DC2
MAMPKSVTRVNKNGVTFISNVDKVQYTIHELSRRALGDSAKFVRKRIIDDLKKLPGMKGAKRPYSGVKFKVARWETGAQIGFSHDTWYGAKSELGTSGQPARNILRNSVYNNIDEIRKIQGQYLSAVNDENRAAGLISEEEYVNAEGED